MADASAGPTPGRFEVRATATDHLAWVRTRLAMERTLMAWVRTGASLIGFGFTIVQFFDRMGELRDARRPRFPNTPRYLGLMLIFCGVAALIVSALQYRSEVKDLSRGDFALIAGGGLPTSSQGHCGAVTPQGGGALVALVLECSAVLVPSTAQGRGAPLRCAPFGVTSTARGALPGGRSGRRDGRHGRTKGWDQGQAAAASAACSRLKGVWVLSMAQATARSRSATLRRARPWL